MKNMLSSAKVCLQFIVMLAMAAQQSTVPASFHLCMKVNKFVLT